VSSGTFQKISNEIEKLSESEQLLLASGILDRLVKQRDDLKKLDFRDLRGAGKGTWSKENIQAYIDNERNEWER